MADSISSTSPTSLSTFSFGTTATSGSYTSEEQPDLGAGFRTVLRELTYLQPPPRIPAYNHQFDHSVSRSLSHTEDGRRSTVWAYEPIAQYLEDPVDDRETDTDTDTDTIRSVHIETETEIGALASPTASTFLVDDFALTLRTQPSPPATGASVSLEFQFDLDQHDHNSNHNHNLDADHERESGPSLGYLDQALSFIAAERAQLAARKSQLQSEAWHHVVDPHSTPIRRKRRRRKPRSRSLFNISIEDDDDEEDYRHATEEDDDDTEGYDERLPYYSSISKYQSKSTPLTPRTRSPTFPSNSSTSKLSSSFLPLPIQARVHPSNFLSSSDSPFTSSNPGGTKRPARKRTRAKHRKIPVMNQVPSSASLVYPPSSTYLHTHKLTHARSVPSLRTICVQHEKPREGVGVTNEGTIDIDIDIDPYTQKLVTLSRYLAKISPAERGVLEGVERKMVVSALRRSRAAAAGFDRKEREEHDDGDREDVLDPRGRAPREEDPPVHVFIDHSNILFGFLTYLKKHPHLMTTTATTTMTTTSTTTSTLRLNLNSGSALRNMDKYIGNNKIIQVTGNNAELKSRTHVDIASDNEATVTATSMKEKKERAGGKGKEKEKDVPRILTRPKTMITSPNTNTSTSPNTNIPTLPNSTNSTFNFTSLPASTTLIQTQTHVEHTTPIPLPSFATALTGTISTSTNTTNSDIKFPTSASTTKTRTRSRSRKARKAAHVVGMGMGMTSAVDDREVVLLDSIGEEQKERLRTKEGRKSLRAVAHREGVGEEDVNETGVEDEERNGEANGEGEGGRDGENGQECDNGEPEVEFKHEKGRTGESGQESGPGLGLDQSTHGHGQGEGKSHEEDVEDGEEDGKALAAQSKKGTSSKTRQKQRHLSHTSLALILERGRPVSRRVAVTSSPLYQPMDTLERLGYEVRVYIRVPDLGDGMDRAAKKKSLSHRRHLSGGNTSGGDGSGSPGTSPVKPTLSSFTSTSTYQHFSSTLPTPAIPTTPARVRYREQGVDELLQLKLHQALAATDDVPPGATIVLATGDGNVGQFNEDGFLGSVRTALRRGWRVELYAWEEGLSRAWKREFGPESEWARNGMFQIIGMDQFAPSLVKGGL
ncbi:hypothetical protein H2248_003459 [Termitomyces sp. 'cryptogamus']|nr:hypothetical protein H2248_003459 [Termitomyces sp. 'cryptogamus']